MTTRVIPIPRAHWKVVTEFSVYLLLIAIGGIVGAAGVAGILNGASLLDPLRMIVGLAVVDVNITRAIRVWPEL